MPFSRRFLEDSSRYKLFLSETEQKSEMRKRLDSYLSNLLDYGSVNRNKAYQEEKKHGNILSDFDEF